MKILALILARGGSKRLPNKNILPLGGRPLITWSIDVAKNVSKIVDILVSTDSPTIASISKDAGAIVPWLRPENLATDNATSADAAIHALEWYEKNIGSVDGILLLQPTSPFRSKSLVEKGIELFGGIGNGVIGVSPAKGVLIMQEHFLKSINQIMDINDEAGGSIKTFCINGSFYLIAPSELKEKRSFFSKSMRPLIITDPMESLDIDSEWDFKIAEMVANKK